MTSTVLWSKLRQLAFVAVLCLVVGGAHVVAASPWFGWYDNASGNFEDRAAQMAAHASHASITMSVQFERPEDWQAARAARLAVGLIIPHELFWAVSDADPRIPDPAAVPMDCRGDWLADLSFRPTWCHKTLADWLAVLRAHQADIAFVQVTDEIGCHLDDGSTYPLTWWPESCRRAAAKRDTLHWAIKQWLPWVRTYSNELAAYPYYWRLAQQRGHAPGVFGVSVPAADLLWIDCYTPYRMCCGPHSVANLLSAWTPFLAPHQRYVLIPRAFMGPYLGWNPAPSEIGVMAWQYYGLTQTDPRVEGVLAFLWRSPTGAQWSPALLADYVAIGQLLTGRRHEAPKGLRIVRES